MAAELRIVRDLLASPPEATWAELSGPSISRLTADGKLTGPEAHAAIEAWAQALGLTFADAPFAPLESIPAVAERQERDRRDRQQASAWAGGFGGAGAGLTVAMILATCWFFWKCTQGLVGAQAGVADVITEWVAAVAAGTVGGAVVGALAGGWLRHALPGMARLISGGAVGMVLGAVYHPLWRPVVEKQLSGDWGGLVQMLTGAMVGLVGGGLVGLVADYFPRQFEERGIDDPGCDENAWR